MLDSLIGPQRTPPHQPSTHTYRLSKFLKNPPHPQRRSEILTAFIPTVNSPASRFQPRNTRKTLPHSSPAPATTQPLTPAKAKERRIIGSAKSVSRRAPRPVSTETFPRNSRSAWIRQ